MPTALLIDAAGTLIQTAEPVGEIYSSYFLKHGAALPASTITESFSTVFKASPAPAFGDHPDGDIAEKVRWKGLVHTVLHHAGPEGAALADSDQFAPCFEALYAHYALPEAWILFPDTLPFLESASPSYRLAVVSNFDQRLHHVFKGLGLTPYFEFILTSAAARASKPDPAIFHHALATLGLPPSETAHVGDCPRADLAGAKSAGIPAFHLKRPELGLPDFLDFCRSQPN
jgi:putative hydrolase of the HAD superfamily